MIYEVKAKKRWCAVQRIKLHHVKVEKLAISPVVEILYSIRVQLAQPKLPHANPFALHTLNVCVPFLYSRPSGSMGDATLDVKKGRKLSLV
jgi:hypothetical protein